MKEKSAGLVLIYDRKIVLLKRSKGYWELPKGHIEQGETAIGAAIRETIEETGIKDFEIIPGWKVKINYSYWFKRKKIEKEVEFYMARVKTFQEPKPSSEHIDARWIDIDQALRTVSFTDLKEVLQRAKEFIDKNG